MQYNFSGYIHLPDNENRQASYPTGWHGSTSCFQSLLAEKMTCKHHRYILVKPVEETVPSICGERQAHLLSTFLRHSFGHASACVPPAVNHRQCRMDGTSRRLYHHTCASFPLTFPPVIATGVAGTGGNSPQNTPGSFGGPGGTSGSSPKKDS